MSWLEVLTGILRTAFRSCLCSHCCLGLFPPLEMGENYVQLISGIMEIR